MCFVCKRMKLIQQGKNKYFVRELQTGYVVMGDYQRFEGYTLFLCKEHVSELHLLEREFRTLFLQEMALVAEAVYKAFSPDKLNYELLGMGDAVHMHWHLFPRKEGDTKIPGPVWKLSAEEMYDPAFIPDQAKLDELKNRLGRELDMLLAT